MISKSEEKRFGVFGLIKEIIITTNLHNVVCIIMVLPDSRNDINDHAVRELLTKLHEYYLKDNKYDEGDLLFYRINYKLIDNLGITNAIAEEFHRIYHNDNPRRISEGYCKKCDKIITIIPIIYGVSDFELEYLLKVENNGKLIIGNTNDIKEGNNIAMFGCKVCKTPLPQYGKVG